MAYVRKEIGVGDIKRQEEYCAEIFDRITANGARPLAMVDTYGCQQNEADSEKIRGYLAEMAARASPLKPIVPMASSPRSS